MPESESAKARYDKLEGLKVSHPPSRLLRRCVAALLTLFFASGLAAQRAFEASGDVIYEDAQGNRTNLGVGFNPVLTHDGRITFIRGRRFGYGDQWDCDKEQSRNWVSIYNPATKAERTLFDRTIPFEGVRFCVFVEMQLSYDGSLLYLVSPVYATSGSLAIINLVRGSITYDPGVNLVYVIETGPHRDELIYQRRYSHGSVEHGPGFRRYPIVHARANGQEIAEISNEDFPFDGNNEVPLLREYLRKIGATISVNGQKLP